MTVRERTRPEPAPSPVVTKRPRKPAAPEDLSRWREDNNARRKEKYATDPEYREKMRREARTRKRTSYSKDCESAGRIAQQVKKDSSVNLGNADEFAHTRKSMSGQDIGCLTIEELGEFVMYHPMVVRRWIANGQLLPPCLEVIPLGGDKPQAGRTTVGAYSISEADAILRCLVKHQEEFRYFRTTHLTTIESLRRALTDLRG